MVGRNLWAACNTLLTPAIQIPVVDITGITHESDETVRERLHELRENNQKYYARKLPAIKKKEHTWKLHHIQCDYGTFSTFLQNQQYECACCGVGIHEHSAYVDYSAVTGIVRGLLCNNCDLMLIGACDNVEKLISGIVYMRSFFNAPTEPKMYAIRRNTTNGYM